MTQLASTCCRPNGPTSVLIVTDAASFADAASAYLAQRKSLCVLGVAANGRDAVVRVVELHPDVALVDLSMRDLSALGCITALREQSPSLRIIALTLWDVDASREPALQAGADEVVPITAPPDDIVSVILFPRTNGDRCSEAQPWTQTKPRSCRAWAR